MTTVIVGAGIAGLWLAEHLANRGDRVLVLEKYDYLGGRVLTSAKHRVEIGAGRIHGSHRRVLSLIRRFGLTTIPLNPASDWRPRGSTRAEPNLFDEMFAPILDVFARLPADVLATHTPRSLANRVMGLKAARDLFDQYPYRAEVERLRADLGLQAFRREMGSDQKFFVVREGLSTLIKHMARACREIGVRIRTGTAVTAITASEDGGYRVETAMGRPVVANRVILTVPVNALRHITLPVPTSALRHLVMAPLTRVYATYPLDPKTGRVWFADMPRTITNSPLRYLIPIDPSRGMIMISYVDDRDTRAWAGLRGPQLAAAIQQALRRLMPEREIPDPTWIHAYEWSDGCTYWRPGLYDPYAVAHQLMHPAPGLYICGESLSVGRQAWMEGALDTAAQVLRRLD